MPIFLLIVSSVCLALISITMLARANDLRWKEGLAWNARLIGFVFTGFSPFGIIARELITGNWPDLYDCFFRCGLALVFLTTPYLPPWWEWISGTAPEQHPYRRKTD